MFFVEAANLWPHRVAAKIEATYFLARYNFLCLNRRQASQNNPFCHDCGMRRLSNHIFHF